jgi:hypothetical protein
MSESRVLFQLADSKAVSKACSFFVLMLSVGKFTSTQIPNEITTKVIVTHKAFFFINKYNLFFIYLFFILKKYEIIGKANGICFGFEFGLFI